MQALLVVDIQNDFCPGGALAVPGGDIIIPTINKLIQRFDHVLLTQDWHPVGHFSFASTHPGKRPYDIVEFDYGEQILWPDHCIQGGFGSAFHSDLNIDRAEVIIRKGYRKQIDSYSAFFENDHITPTGLLGYFRERGIENLFIVGLALDFCVYWSAVDAKKHGFEVMVIEDACRAIDTNGSLQKAMNEMRANEVKIMSSAEL